MSGRHDKLDDSRVDEMDSRDLEAIEAQLRASAPEPADPHFFDALQQRIMNEVEVTPLPRAVPRTVEVRPKLLERILAWLRESPVAATGVLAGVVALALALWVFGSDPAADLPAPIEVADGVTDGASESLAVTVPDELWEDGFLENAWVPDEIDEIALLSASIDESYAEEDEAVGYTDDWGSWSLDALSTEELLALEAALEG